MLAAQRDASLSRRKIGPRDVQEDRTPVATDSRPRVVADDDHDVVEAIFTPQLLRARRVGKLHGAIVVTVPRSVAPAVVGPDRLNGQRRARSPDAIGTIKNAQEAKAAQRSRAVAFAFARPPAGTAQYARQIRDAQSQHPATRGQGQGGYGNDGSPASLRAVGQPSQRKTSPFSIYCRGQTDASL
jgi:hypothetical protein